MLIHLSYDNRGRFTYRRGADDRSETGGESGEMPFKSGVGLMDPREDIMRRSEGGSSLGLGWLEEEPAPEFRDGVGIAGAALDGLDEVGTPATMRSGCDGPGGREVWVACLDGLDAVSANDTLNCPPGYGIKISSSFAIFPRSAGGPADHELNVGIGSIDGVDGPVCRGIETAFFRTEWVPSGVPGTGFRRSACPDILLRVPAMHNLSGMSTTGFWGLSGFTGSGSVGG